MLHCQLRYPTHRVYIQSDSGPIHCFKYTENHCDYQLFDSGDLESLSDYIMLPILEPKYQLVLGGDSTD